MNLELTIPLQVTFSPSGTYRELLEFVPTTESTQVEDTNSSHNTHQVYCSIIPELVTEGVVE